MLAEYGCLSWLYVTLFVKIVVHGPEFEHVGHHESVAVALRPRALLDS